MRPPTNHPLLPRVCRLAGAHLHRLASYADSTVKRGLSLVLVVVLVLSSPLSAIASTQSELDSFLNEWEIQLRTTAPGFYQGQQRGFITGGAADVRFPARHIVPLTLSLPSVKAGCGGISFFGGAFSYINSENFTQFLQNIAQNAVGVAFDMALRTLCPQCATVLANMEAIVRSMTGSLANSCRAAKALVQAIAPSNLQEIAHDNCTAINSILGVTEDAWGSAFKCPSKAAQKDADLRGKLYDALHPSETPLRSSQNVFWAAYNKLEGLNPFWDTDHGQYMMSLFGTLVINYKPEDTDADPEYTPKSETLTASHLLSGWAEGERQILTCNEPQDCLTVTARPGAAFIGLETTVETKLVEYVTHLQGRTRTNPEPILTANVAGVPIVRLLTMVSGVPGGQDQVVSITKRIVAVNLLRALIKQTLPLIRQEMKRVKDVGFGKTYLETLNRRSTEIEREFSTFTRELADANNNLRAIVQLAREMQAQSSPGLMGNLGFATRTFNPLTAR